jgi:hypothetical protein
MSTFPLADAEMGENRYRIKKLTEIPPAALPETMTLIGLFRGESGISQVRTAGNGT